MVRASLAAFAISVVLLAVDAPAASFAKQELSIPMDDGVSIAATLYLPDAAPPPGGWPALVFLHGLAGERSQMNLLAETLRLVDTGYAVLTFDARGHGQSGGLVGIVGPREVADTRAVHAWLAARPDVSDAKIGAFGLSYGGGAVLNSLVAGVPWAAIATAATWTDLAEALMPQGLLKSGLVAALAGSVEEARRDPALAGLQAAALAGDVRSARAWAQERSSLGRLGAVSTPVFLAQGRRDFLFGLDQGTKAFQRLRGPKVLWVGLHGHAPSTFPAADSGLLLGEVRTFFDCYLQASSPCAPQPPAVFVVPESFAGRAVRYGNLPRTRPTTIPLPGVTTFARAGRATRRSSALPKAVEVFGSPTAQVSVAASGGWSRLVAVLTARTPQGREIVVGAGGVPTKDGVQKVVISLASQATFVPRGSRLTLTLASSSVSNAATSSLYADVPMRASARIRIGPVVLRVPSLRTSITK